MTRFSRISKNPKVPAKVKQAFELMQADPSLDIKAASAKVGIDYYRVRRALKLPHVALWARNEHKARVDEICAANPERLREIADKSENDMTRVAGAKTLEAMKESLDPGAAAVQRGPGLQIVIVQNDGSQHVVPPPQPSPMIDINPELRRVQHEP
jgi:hypothetical protein